MSLQKLKSQFPSMRNKIDFHKIGLKSHKELFPSGGGPQDDFLYSFLALIYDGYTRLDEIKSQMRYMFTTTMRQLVITEENVDGESNVDGISAETLEEEFQNSQPELETLDTCPETE